MVFCVSHGRVRLGGQSPPEPAVFRATPPMRSLPLSWHRAVYCLNSPRVRRRFESKNSAIISGLSREKEIVSLPCRTEAPCGTSEIEAERGPEQSGEPKFGDIRELASLTEVAHREGVSPEGLDSLSYLADPFEGWHTKSDLGYRSSLCMCWYSIARLPTSAGVLLCMCEPWRCSHVNKKRSKLMGSRRGRQTTAPLFRCPWHFDFHCERLSGRWAVGPLGQYPERRSQELTRAQHKVKGEI